MGDPKQEIEELKDKLIYLERRIQKLEERLETKFNTLKSEMDDLAVLLRHISCHAERERKLIEEIDKLINCIYKVLEEIGKPKKKSWLRW